MACEFCEMYETGKTIVERLYGDDSEVTAELKVALVTETYRDGYHTGTLRDRAVELIFCPQCGKRIEKQPEPFYNIDEGGYVLFNDGHRENILSHYIDTDGNVLVRTEHRNKYAYSECLIDIAGYKVKHHAFAKYDREKGEFIGMFDIEKFVLKWDVVNEHDGL